MLKSFLGAFSRQSLQRMSLNVVSRVKIRWRHNPGFVAAGAAGSIGLVLAVVLGVQGAFRLLDGESAGDELTEMTSDTTLDEPVGNFGDEPSHRLEPRLPRNHDRAASIGKASTAAAGLMDDEDDGMTGKENRLASRRNWKKVDDLLDDLEDDDSISSRAQSKSSSRPERDPFGMDDDADADEQPVHVRPRARHVLDENPLADELADEDTPPRKTVPSPVAVAEDVEPEEEDVEPARVAVNSPASKSLGDKGTNRGSISGPSFGGADADEKSADEESDDEKNDDADLSSVAASPAVNRASTPPAGWKHPLSRSDSAAEPSTAVAQQSRAVETVIFAAPAAEPATTVDQTAGTTADDEVAPARLGLEVAGPKSARIGETCNFEIRVKNPGRTAIEKITLSVELPDELVHEVAQTLEQKVEAIGPGKTYRALVRTRAKGAGKVTLSTDVAIQGRVDTRTATTIDIGTGANSRPGISRAPRR